LTVGRYRYRGDRGRRDPWIDPRVPLMGPENGWAVPDQLAKVDELSALTAEAMQRWLAVEGAQNVLDRLVKRDELEAKLGELDEELRRIEAEGAISYVPAQKRMEIEVYEPRMVLAGYLDKRPEIGPTRAELESVVTQMVHHIELLEYALALKVFKDMESSLDMVVDDPVRNAIAAQMRELATEAETLHDFAAIELEFGGSVFIGDRDPVIVVNGRSRTVGDEVAPGLEIAAIRKNEVDFYFRGFVLTRVH
jgi:hypothetical protein